MPREARTGLVMIASLLALGAPASAAERAAAPRLDSQETRLVSQETWLLSQDARLVPQDAWLLSQEASLQPLFEPPPAVSLPWEQAVMAGLPPRQPWLAAGLSVAVTGSGQFYNRNSPMGWWLFGTLATYPVAMAIDAFTGSGYARVGAFTLMMAAKGYSAWEAFHTAAASASATP